MIELIPSKVVPIDSIHPNKWNPNFMDEETFVMLQESMKTFGFCQAVLILEDGTIIDGEQRWRAMRDAGATEIEVKVIGVDELVAMEGTVNFNLLKGVFDKKKLGDLILRLEQDKGREYVQSRLAIERAAYNAAIAKAQGKDEPVEESEVVASKKLPVVNRGDVYRLGDHLLICGDSCDPSLVNQYAKNVRLIITDPPYMVGNKSEGRGIREYRQKLTEADWEDVFNINEFLGSIEGTLFKDATVYIFASQYTSSDIIRWMEQQMDFFHYLVWCKPNGFPTANQNTYTWSTELIWYGKVGKPVFNYISEGNESNYIVMAAGKHLTPHPAEKPVELIKHIILRSSNRGDTVFDFFGGSGSTLIAAEQTDRKCVIFEMEPLYAEVTLHRWEQFTGKIGEKVA